MLSLQNVSVSLSGREILSQVNFQIADNQKVALVGRNGSGKSTIFKVIEGLLAPDRGEVQQAKNWKILSIKQEMPDGELTPIEHLLASDTVRLQLFEELNNLTDMSRITEICEKLEVIDAYSAEARASKILKGLGFDEEDQHRPMKHFSGGFRMRVALAAALFQAPDLLLLDEPTNHLDLETVEWLKNFLNKYQGSFLLISHERDFLNDTSNYILHLNGGKIDRYKGNFDEFVNISNLKRKNLEDYNAKIAAKKQHMLDFVKRFGAKASKAKQAQSRMKMIEKMNFVDVAPNDPTISFKFPECVPAGYPLCTFDKISIGYGNEPVVQNISGDIALHDRIALVGRNGQGKSTFAKFLAGELRSLKGSRRVDNKFRVGFYKQDQLEDLNLNLTVIEYMRSMFESMNFAAEKPVAKYQLASDAPNQNPNYTEQNIRSHLACFGFDAEYMEQKIDKLSGGERARLLFASLTLERPNLLILDEPTNHLDIEMREALMTSLNDYSGAVIIITHDKYLLQGVADQIWIIKNKKLVKFDGSIEDYEFN